jgi:DnaA family protein
VAQLPLALELADHARFSTFIAGANEPAAKQVREIAGGEPGVAWLFGSEGAGKTHLLQSACRAAAESGRRAMYVPVGGAEMHPGVLTDLEGLDLLALDDVDAVAGRAEWERNLFLALDDGHARRTTGLLLAARTPPAGCRWQLPDLKSRAVAAVAFRLQPLGGDARLEALLAHAAARGLDLEPAAAEYLLNRIERDWHELLRWLDRLDRASLAEQRKLTIPFIRGVLRAPASGE